MRLVLQWSTGRYDDSNHHTVPFEYESPEDLYEILNSKKIEYDLAQKKRYKVNQLFREGKISSTEYLEKTSSLHRLHTLYDRSGRREINIASMKDGPTWADVSIFTLDQWFESQ